MFVFMDNETYDQFPINAELVGNQARLMKEGQEAAIAFNDAVALSVELPPNVMLRVTQTEPGVRGDTATNVSKPATLETGAEVKVPIFVNEGDLLKIDTRTGDYVERVKE
jgi:elongation factor P